LDSSTNCVGVNGWNDVNPNPPTTLALSFQNGDACFVGTVAEVGNGWGAVYDFAFANSGTWNATANGVSGFEFKFSGSTPPASLKIIYKDSGGTDFCRNVAPGTVALPFADAHPSCATSGSGVVDPTDMEEIILAFLPGANAPYPVNFCLQITALQ